MLEWLGGIALLGLTGNWRGYRMGGKAIGGANMPTDLKKKFEAARAAGKVDEAKTIADRVQKFNDDKKAQKAKTSAANNQNDAQEKAKKRLAEIDLETQVTWGIQPSRSSPMPISNPAKFQKLMEERKALLETLNRLPWQKSSNDVQQRENMPKARHRKYVEEALKEGKKVPQSVLDEYPDLKAMAKTQKSAGDKSGARNTTKLEGTEKQVAFASRVRDSLAKDGLGKTEKVKAALAIVSDAKVFLKFPQRGEEENLAALLVRTARKQSPEFAAKYPAGAKEKSPVSNNPSFF
jgi:hypothetical protein